MDYNQIKMDYKGKINKIVKYIKKSIITASGKNQMIYNIISGFCLFLCKDKRYKIEGLPFL